MIIDNSMILRRPPPDGFGYIYMIIVDTGIYVGQTIKDLNTRLIQHKSNVKRNFKTKLYNKIRKYPNSISIELLEIVSKNDLTKVEEFYIKTLKTFSGDKIKDFLNMIEEPTDSPMNNINIRKKQKKSQNTPRMIKRKKEVMNKNWADPVYREKMANQWKDPVFRKKHAESMNKVFNDPLYIEKQRKNSIIMWEDPNFREKYLKIINEPAYKERMFQINKHKSKSVISIETGEIFRSIREAERKTGVERSLISYHCKNKVKNPRWKFFNIQ